MTHPPPDPSQPPAPPPAAPPPDPDPRRTTQEITAALAAERETRILRGRYRRTLWFAAWLFVRVLFWELWVRRLLGENVVAAGRIARMRGWAGEFRALAVDMGGVMIKLGQFISSRIDILPPEVIEVLAALQDEVPTVPFGVIRARLVEELGPLPDHFAHFEQQPIAAASLGQAHRATLHDGGRVVVKVQRPGIHVLVHTDLSALQVVAGWAMRFRFIRRRADAPALLDEFAASLWEELDYRVEAQHIQAFADLFARDPGIYIPRHYPALSSGHVLTLEDVTAIKIGDFDRITASGVDRRDVARRLINTYLHMVFVERFFHADPHPGNLFVYPLPADAPAGAGQHVGGQPLLGRPFYLVFVDFGMVGRVTREIVDGLGETLIALTTRDPHRLVRSYQRLGILLPGADLKRIEDAARAAFDRVWGLSMAEMTDMPLSEMTELGREFSDLMFSLPFQVPQDFLLLGRAVGILSGLCTGLDPGFDPWREIHPFVETLLAENDELPPLPTSLDPRDLLKPETLRRLLSADTAGLVLNTGVDLARRAVQLPALADDVLRRADRGELTIRATPTDELERTFARLEHGLQRMALAMTFAGLAISSAVLYSAGEAVLSTAGFVLSGITFLRVVFGGR